MIVPLGGRRFADALKMSVEVFHSLKRTLHERGLSTAVGDEGGFAPDLKLERGGARGADRRDPRRRLRPRASRSRSRSTPPCPSCYRDGAYVLEHEGRTLTADELASYWAELAGRYPIVSLEDGMAEEDWSGWSTLTSRLGNRLQLVGDDVFVTNTERLKRGIDSGVANSILIKVNQIGTLTETLAAIRMAREAGYTSVISHRSGETEDVTIADLAVATGAGQIKTGASVAHRPGGEVQPAAADRGGARPGCGVPGAAGVRGVGPRGRRETASARASRRLGIRPRSFRRRSSRPAGPPRAPLRVSGRPLHARRRSPLLRIRRSILCSRKDYKSVERSGHGMPSARSATAASRRARTAPRSAAGPWPRRVPTRGALTRIRWDRLGRIALLVVLVVVAGLYVRQGLSLLSTHSQAERELGGRSPALGRERQAHQGARRAQRSLDDRARRAGPGDGQARRASVRGDRPAEESLRRAPGSER